MSKTFYIACWRPEGGVYAVEFDFEKQRITGVKKCAEGSHTSYLERSGDVLYVLSEIGGPGEFAGKVQSFRLTEKGLAELDAADVLSGSPHIKLSADRKTLYDASYTTGGVHSVSVDDGKFGSVTSHIRHTGKSVNAVRQEGSHAHMMCLAPDGDHIVCVDLGTDELRVYILREDGTLSEHGIIHTPSGYGPRHMAFSQDGQFAYVVCELQYHLLTYRYLGEGNFELTNDLKIIENLPENQNWGGAIRVSPEGNLLLTTNRGREQSSIDILSLENPAKPVHLYSFRECSHPRDFFLFVEGKKQYLVCLNMTTDTTAFYEFYPDTLSFRLLDETKEIPMPVCVV